MSITTWAVSEAPDGSPLVNAEPTDADLDRCAAVARLNPATRRYTVEAVRADLATAERLAATALTNVYADAASWERVRPGDLVPAEPAPAPQDRNTILPGDPRWAAEAAELLRLGFPDPATREAASERLIARARAEGWSLRAFGQAILRERAEAADAAHVSALHVLDMRDPVAARLGQDDSASVWQRVTRPPREGEVTNATRAGF